MDMKSVMLCFLYSAGHSNGSVQITSVSTNPVGTWASLGDAGEY